MRLVFQERKPLSLRRSEGREDGPLGEVGTEAQCWGAQEVAPAQPVSPVRGQGADREKQVQERALSMCLGGRERGLRGQQGAGRGGCLLRPGLLASLLPAVLWEERNKAG